jgi:DNA-directed RNA polymerase subunit omega
MRLEKVTSKALKNVNEDRYVLALAVAQRAEQLAAGAEPLVQMDKDKSKLADIALMEIAEDKVKVEQLLESE